MQPSAVRLIALLAADLVHINQHADGRPRRRMARMLKHTKKDDRDNDES